ncbi:glycosyltransferase family 2 protein [Parageobacillus toebii]|uniref:glycosyltransferase family 2 protein n=1 Tax=Parageobacillus toebii TaxID=153151 RepID=UPI00196783D6|nr:glycosyltransferase family 2 protein [Parageobacillus toebii]QSB49341.1 glycosyltransferase family 2 protein [Parageobacillus toebii]
MNNFCHKQETGDNNKDSLVSIVTPTYNAERFIKSAIQSVQLQTYSNWEMIIVDDCSQDNTVEIIKNEAEKDKRIKLIQLSKNSGAAVARNTAIQNARGKYIAFLDSDDLWYPEKLEKQVAFMQENDIAFSFTSYRIINEDGTETDKIINVPKEIDYKGLLKNTIIGCLTVMLDVSKLGLVQMPNIRTRQDTALWLSILKKGYKAYGIQEPLAKYRKVKGSISSNKLKMAKQNWIMYRDLENLNVIYASWCFVNYAWNALKKNL